MKKFCQEKLFIFLPEHEYGMLLMPVGFHRVPYDSYYLDQLDLHLYQRICNGIRGSTHSQFQSYYLCYFGTVYFGDRSLGKGVGNQLTFGFRTPLELVILVRTSPMVQSRNLVIHSRPVGSILETFDTEWRLYAT